MAKNTDPQFESLLKRIQALEVVPARTSTYCNECGQDTWHDICATVRDKVGSPWRPDPEDLAALAEDPGLGGYDELAKRVGNTGYEVFQIVKCRGCDSVAFLLSEQAPWDPEPEIYRRYPPAIARRAPKWVGKYKGDRGQHGVPELVCDLMREVYEAVNNDSRRLVAMGVRTVLDIVFVDKVKDIGGFKAKLLELQKAGYLSLRQAGSLDTVLEVGHAAIHRAWEPTENDISTALDITENLIEDLYLHEPAAAHLDKRVPKRQAQADPVPKKVDEKRDGDEVKP